MIAAPQPEVWGLLSDLKNAGRWNSAWSGIEFVSNQTHGRGTKFRARTEDDQAFEFRVSGWIAPEFIEFTPIRDQTERYGIMLESHAFRLRPEGEGATWVELTAKASTHGISGRVLGLFFWRGHQKQGLNAALDRLEASFRSEEADGPDGESTPAE